MTRHEKEAAVLEWLDKFKNRTKPLKLGKHGTIQNPKRFAETYKRRIEAAVSVRVYVAALNKVGAAKTAEDEESI